MKGAGDGFELIGYLIFFWAFIFSKNFREIQIKEWQQTEILNRTFMVFEAVVSFLCGVFLPILLFYWTISN